MRILLANLRLLWQRRSLWALYAGIGCAVGLVLFFEAMGPSPVRPCAAGVLLPLLALGVLPISLIVAFTQEETQSPPFTFTLPGHQSVSRKVVFVVGVAAGLGVALVVWPDSGFIGRFVLTFAATLSISLIVYFLGVVLTYIIILPGLIIAAISMVMVLTGHIWGLAAGAGRVVLDFPIPVILGAFLSAGAAWWYLGHRPHGLRIATCAQEWASSRLIRDGLEGGDPADSPRHQFLLNRMQRAPSLSFAKYIWGILYMWSTFGGWRRELVQVVVVALLFGFVAWYSPAMWPMLILIGSYDDMAKGPLSSSLLLAGGRRERFLGLLVLLLIAGCAWMVSVALSFGAIDLVQFCLPQGKTRISDLESGAPPLDIRLAVLLTAAYPIQSIMDFALSRSSWRYMARVALFLLVGLPVICAGRWLTGIPLAVVALVVIGSWIVGAYGLYRVVMRKDLVPTRAQKTEPDWSTQELLAILREARKRARR